MLHRPGFLCKIKEATMRSSWAHLLTNNTQLCLVRYNNKMAVYASFFLETFRYIHLWCQRAIWS